MPISRTYNQLDHDEYRSCDACLIHEFETGQTYYTGVPGYSPGDMICQSCHDEIMTDLEDEEEQDPAGEYAETTLLNYNYNRPKTYKIGNDGPHFGLEIEVYPKNQASYDRTISDLMREINPPDHPKMWVCKYDASLTHGLGPDSRLNGFELDGLPMTKSALQPSLEILHAWAKRGDLIGFKGRNNGLHVNMDGTLSKQHLQNLRKFWYDVPPEKQTFLEFIAQRALNQYCYVPNKEDVLSMGFGELPKIHDLGLMAPEAADRALSQALNKYRRLKDAGRIVHTASREYQYIGSYYRNSDRHHAIMVASRGNLIDPKTGQTLDRIEFRMFKTNLHKDRINKALDFCAATVDYTRDLPLHGDTSIGAFLAWLSDKVPQYPDLCRYLVSHRSKYRQTDLIDWYRSIPRHQRNLLPVIDIDLLTVTDKQKAHRSKWNVDLVSELCEA